MVVKTPQQLEDAAIADAIRSVVGMYTRRQQRELQNKLTGLVEQQVQLARLNGRKVDLNKFTKEALNEVANSQGIL